MIFRSATLCRALLLVTASTFPGAVCAQVKLHPIAGQDRRITIKRDETQYRIARRYDVSMSDLVRANGKAAERPKAGASLIIPMRRILPATPADGIVLNVPERRIYLFKDGEIVQTHAVGVGRPDWQTAIGNFEVIRKTKNPTWYPPASMVKREGAKDDPVPPGPENPLGDRWIGWSASGFGFHSTNSPRSIGGVVSHGCVRLYPEQAEALFDAVSVGTPIHSVYEPLLLARDGGSFYLSMWPDVYERGGTSYEDVERMLTEARLIGGVDPAALRRIVRRANGLPERIIGSDLTMEANGNPVELPVAPTYIDGRLVAPARALVEALGGSITNEQDGRVGISAGMKKLLLTPGKPDAELDGVTATLPVVPAVVADNLVMPLRTLLDLFGAEMARDGNVLKLKTPVTSGVAGPRR